MHSVHLPFNAAKCIVYMTKQIRIILLILDRQSKYKGKINTISLDPETSGSKAAGHTKLL
jgi:hypothetical protein